MMITLGHNAHQPLKSRGGWGKGQQAKNILKLILTSSKLLAFWIHGSMINEKVNHQLHVIYHKRKMLHNCQMPLKKHFSI
jgi:hypothetical protein